MEDPVRDLIEEIDNYDCDELTDEVIEGFINKGNEVGEFSGNSMLTVERLEGHYDYPHKFDEEYYGNESNGQETNEGDSNDILILDALRRAWKRCWRQEGGYRRRRKTRRRHRKQRKTHRKGRKAHRRRA